MRRAVAATAVSSLVAGSLVLLPVSPVAAISDLTLDKSAPASALLGEDVPYTLKASNTGTAPMYNVSFSDVLPPGMRYKPGSAGTQVGEPKISLNGDQQVLIWSNEADLQPGSSFTLSFTAYTDTPLPTQLDPQLTNEATVATESDPRTLPKFNPDGTVASATASNTDTAVTDRLPFEIQKSEPSPESELLRGVHDQRTVYTLKVRNNESVATNNVVISDYLPANLEFLGCGDTDNTEPNTEVEYPGAPRLGVPPLTPNPCPTPDSVDTELDPLVPGGAAPLGLFTKVTWSIGDLAPGEEKTIKYVAGVPLKANTTNWPATPPSPASLEQGSNLNNNNGPSTRETANEASATNYVGGIGEFEGTPNPTQVETGTSHTVTIEDLRLLKSVSPAKFIPGGIATVTLKIDASEYMDASAITIVDTLPDGFCPMGPQNYLPGSQDCAPTSAEPSTPYDSVTANSDGTFTVTFSGLSVDADGSTTVTFPARMRSEYRGDALAGKPTVAGDSFTNTANLEGTTNPIPAVDGIETGPQSVTDASSASQKTNLPTIDKTIKPRYVGIDCNDLDRQPYTEYKDLSPAERTFRYGDKICFKLRVDFPDISTKNVLVSDFVPFGTEYISGSATPTVNNTVTIADVDVSGTPLTATLGTQDGSDYFVGPSEVFEAVLAVTVLEPAGGNTPDLIGNLMKMRTENTAGQAESYRDEADFDLAPPANLQITKGVAETTLPAATYDPPADNKPVQQGSVATFQVDVTNRPRPDFPGTEFSVRTLQVWDVLPAGLRCDAVSNFRYIEPGTTTVTPLTQYVQCIDPPVNAQSDSSYIQWSFPGPSTNAFTLFTGETLGLLYDMAIPNEVSVSTKYANTAYVRSFQSFTDIFGQASTYYPANNIDVTVLPDEWDAPELKDPSNVYVPNATTGKTAVTSVTEANNNLATQATIGESITYTYSVTVPANTTVYNGSLSDTLPTGIELVSVDDWGMDGFTNKPAGFSLDSGTGTLTFPDTYTNTTNQNQVFQVEVTAQVTGDAATCADPCPVPPSPATDVAKTNTAKFSSRSTLDGAALPDRVRNYTVNIVQPNPRITKTASPDNLPASNSSVSYTVKLTNPTGRPPLHNSVVIDCLPSPLTVDLITSTSQGSAVVTTDPSCAATDTAIKWTVGDVAPGASPTLRYRAHLEGTVPGNTTYTNQVALTGTSMPGDVTGERTYLTDAEASIVTPGIGLAKNTTPEFAPVGETVMSQIAITLKANTVYYAPSVVDTLPAGIDPASLKTPGVTCVRASDGMPCPPPIISATALPASGQKIGWTLGDSLTSPFVDQDAIITLIYRVTIDDVAGNVAGTTLTNSAKSFSTTDSETNPPTTITEAENLPDSQGPVSDKVTVVEPDLDLVKKVDDSDSINAVPGQEFRYTITVTNSDAADASTAYDAVVTDTLPAGIEIVGSPSDGGVVNGNVITWTLASLDPGGSKTFSYLARLKPPATGVQQNTAVIDEYYGLDGGQGRKYTGPDDTAEVVPTLPELSVTKYPSADLAYIDEPYTWILEITNVSQATAYAIGAKDTLPKNWEYVTDTATINVDGVESQVNPAIAGQLLTWSALGDLPAGATATIVYQAKPTAAVISDPGVGLDPPVPQTNTVRASWTDGPGDQPWPSRETNQTETDTYIAKADLALSKTHVTNYNSPVTGDQVVPGTEFDWKIEVVNNGPDTSEGPFTVTDTLPAGVTFQSASGIGWSCTPAQQVITCTNSASSVLSGDSLPALRLTVKVDPAVTGSLQNTATVTGPTYDPDISNNTDDDTVTTRPLADLAITKTGGQNYVVGGTVSYNLAVTNLGPSTSAAPITVEDTLPPGVSITSVNSGAWLCTPTSGPATKLTCTLNQSLAPNSQADVIGVTVEVLESPGTQAVNTAKVTGPTEDPDPGNNESSVTDNVTDDVKLGIAKATTGANPVAAGDTTEFTITVTNDGPAKAKNVQVVDELQSGLIAQQAGGQGWTCDVGGGSRVVCQRPDFKVTDSPSVIVVKARVAPSVPAGTRLGNIATVTTTSPQPGGDPDPAESTVDVVTRSDLAIEKTHRKQRWTVNGTGTWDLTVTNNGPSDNKGPITVTDTIPAGTRYVSASGPGWECQGTTTITCTLNSGLTAGASSVIAVTVTVEAAAVPRVRNQATVTSPVEDPNPGNNRSEDEVPVDKARQTVKNKLPSKPFVLPAGYTEQGQKIRTRVRCLPVQRGSAGEVSYCRVKRSKNGTVRVKVQGTRPVRVIVTQTAKGTDAYRPFKRVKKYIVRP